MCLGSPQLPRPWRLESPLFGVLVVLSLGCDKMSHAILGGWRDSRQASVCSDVREEASAIPMRMTHHCRESRGTSRLFRLSWKGFGFRHYFDIHINLSLSYRSDTILGIWQYKPTSSSFVRAIRGNKKNFDNRKYEMPYLLLTIADYCFCTT